MWERLRPFVEVERCADCECLQAGLTELVMRFEEHPDSSEKDALLATVRAGQDLSRLHGCLGCEPCEPAESLAVFYRTSDAAATAARCDCGSGYDHGTTELKTSLPQAT
jgi:hypothetical protein